MMANTRKFWLGLSIMVGTIVGVGIFGIPYAISKSGFGLGVFYLVVLGLAMVFVHLFFGEITLRTRGKHRLVGYAEIYLGKKGKIIAAAATIFGLYGSLLAYIIVAGQFLHEIFGPLIGGSSFVYSLIFYFVGIIGLYMGLKLISHGELIMTVFLLLIVAVIFMKGFPHIDYTNLATVGFKDFFLPYGVILFSLGGITAVPELKTFMAGRQNVLKNVLIWGTLIPIAIYFIFSFVVVGVTGAETSSEAIRGLDLALRDGILTLGAIFGFLTVTTSFFVIGLNLKETFWYDYKINHELSWLLTILIPFLIFILGLRSFIAVIDVVGVFMGGLTGILIILMYKKAKYLGKRKPEYSIRPFPVLRNVLIGIFVLGILYEIVYLFL